MYLILVLYFSVDILELFVFGFVLKFNFFVVIIFVDLIEVLLFLLLFLRLFIVI